MGRTSVHQRRCCYRHNGCKPKEKVQQIIKQYSTIDWQGRVFSAAAAQKGKPFSTSTAPQHVLSIMITK